MGNGQRTHYLPSWVMAFGLMSYTAASSPPQDPEQQGAEQFFAIRTALVAVTDDQGNLVQGLNVEDFGLEEKGVPRDIVNISWAEGDTEVYLLVDTSVVFQGEVLALRRAAQAFLEAVRPGDRVAFYEYGQRPRRRVDPTGGRIALQNSAARLNAWPEGAYLLDAIEEVGQEIIESGRERKAHPVTVAILGGAGPDFSSTPYRRAIDIGTQTGATFHVVMMSQATVAGDAIRQAEVDQTLQTLIKNNGGSLRRVLTAQALEPEMAGLAQEIFQSGYHVSFLTEVEHATLPEELTISVSRPELSVEVLTVLPWERRVPISVP